MDDTPDTGHIFNRRQFLSASATTFGVLAGVGTSTGTATAATTTRDHYTIMTGTSSETGVFVYDSGRDGPTTLVVGGMHGDEEPGYTAAGRIATWAVDKGKLVVIPKCNVRAIKRDVRGIEHDLNRQFPPLSGDCTSDLAAAIWAEVERHDPDWAFDLHSARGAYGDGHKDSVGQALFPTFTAPARKYGENTVAALNDRFGLSGRCDYQMGNTIDADRYMLMHRIAGHLGAPGYICEVAENCGDSVKERVRWHLFTVEHVMNQYGQHRVTTRNLPLEAQQVAVADGWREVSFDGSLNDPVVISKAPTIKGIQPAHTRLRNCDDDSASIRIEEWDYMNGSHSSESVGLFVATPGTYDLQSGAIEVGHTTADDTKTTVTYEADFDRQPVVLAQAQTCNGPHAIVTRVSDVDADGFAVRLQEQESHLKSDDKKGHAKERIGYIAVSPGVHQTAAGTFEAGHVNVDSHWRPVSFDGDHDDPTFVAGVSSINGWQPCSVRRRGLGSDGVELRVEEEESADSEVGHVDERVDYLVLG